MTYFGRSSLDFMTVVHNTLQEHNMPSDRRVENILECLKIHLMCFIILLQLSEHVDRQQNISLFNLILFAAVKNEITPPIKDEILWCILFTNDIVLVDDTRDGVNAKLEITNIRTLRVRLTQYMKCNFSTSKSRVNMGNS